MRRVLPIALLVIAQAVAPTETDAAGFSPAATPKTSCSADCDGSGGVTVDELIQLVNIALGTSSLSGCFCADNDRNGAVTVDEILAAETDALQGCIAPQPEAVARSVVSLIRSLADVPAIATPVSLAIGAAGPDPDVCATAGGFENSCSEIGTRVVHIPVDMIGCEVDSPEGRTRFDGKVDVVAKGACPDVLVPANIQLRVALDAESRDLESTAGVNASFDLDVFLSQFLFGARPCQLAGAQSKLSGDLQLQYRDGAEVSLSFADVATTVKFEEFRYDFDCEPGIISTSLEGPLRASDSALDADACAKTSGLTVRRDRRRDLLGVDGGMSSPALGGAVELETVEPIGDRFGDLCLRGGEVRVDGAGGTMRLSFGDDGAIRVDGEGIDTTLSEFSCGRCGDGIIDPTEECDDGNSASGDGCSGGCVVEACRECSGTPSHCEVVADGSGCDDGLDCTGADRCVAGMCSVHSAPCLIVADRFAARILAVDLADGEARVLSDRNNLKAPSGVVVEPGGQFLVSNNDYTEPQSRYTLMRIDPRTGTQQVAMELTQLDGAGALLREPSGSLLITSENCCSERRGGVFRIDPRDDSEVLVWESPPNASHPKSMAWLSDGEALVTFNDTAGVFADEPGHLFRGSTGLGDLAEIVLDTPLYHPWAVAVSREGDVLLLDNGLSLGPNQILRVDLESGHAEPISSGGLLYYPYSLVVAPDSSLLVGDGVSGGGQILRIDAETGAQRQLVGPKRVKEPVAMVVTPVCGNGIIEVGESCDDGNIDDGDGCSTVCLTEPGV